MAAVDTFAGKAPSLLTVPATKVVLVTPSDIAELTYVSRGIAFAGAGDLKIVTQDGDTVVIPSGALSAGTIHPIRVRQVYATLTTATSISVYW